MRATAVEVHYATLIRQLIFVAAFATYFVDPDDVVWRFIRQYSSRRWLEHALFLIATLLIGAAAILCTRSSAYIAHASPRAAPQAPIPASYGRLRGAHHLGDLLYAIGLASLAPLWGSVLLITGESIRILRLARSESALRRDRESIEDPPARAMSGKTREPSPRWGAAFRQQATKWGVFLTMIVFTITLIDSVADYGIVASVLAWPVLNLPFARSDASGS